MKPTTISDLVDMKIHDVVQVDLHTCAIRVPGGLLYRTTVVIDRKAESTSSVHQVFVPFVDSVMWMNKDRPSKEVV